MCFLDVVKVEVCGTNPGLRGVIEPKSGTT
jgi:hypothetical protein